MKTVKLKYKGYTGSVEWSDEDNCYFGRVVGMEGDCITYEGDDTSALESDFRDAVDTYLNSCERRGTQPRRPYSGTLSLHVSPDEHSRIAVLARKMGMSVSAYVRHALSLL